LNPTISTTNNWFDSGQGYSYDSSGNTTADAEGRTFVYDAENKQVEVIESSVTIGEYFYDGDGKRVKKIAGAEETIFVYDAGGKLIGEYSSIVQTGSNAKTVYTTNDHLGSPRINTDGTGQVISRHDYHPFGEEIARTGYGSDTIRKQFTGYERDGETGVDFAGARYYNSLHGRFTTPDHFGNDSHIVQPQSWNLYQYVRNNPLRFVDATGEKLTILLNGSRYEVTMKGNSFLVTRLEGSADNDARVNDLVSTVGGRFNNALAGLVGSQQDNLYRLGDSINADGKTYLVEGMGNVTSDVGLLPDDRSASLVAFASQVLVGDRLLELAAQGKSLPNDDPQDAKLDSGEYGATSYTTRERMEYEMRNRALQAFGTPLRSLNFGKYDLPRFTAEPPPLELPDGQGSGSAPAIDNSPPRGVPRTPPPAPTSLPKPRPRGNE
jgi:RHS repeat-associated protein